MDRDKHAMWYSYHFSQSHTVTQEPLREKYGSMMDALTTSFRSLPPEETLYEPLGPWQM